MREDKTGKKSMPHIELRERIAKLSPEQRKQFELKLKQENIDISKFTHSSQHLEEDRYDSITPVEKKEYHPLSSAQERFFMLQAMNESSTAFNISFFKWLEGTVHPHEFVRISRGFIHRHETLRTSFRLIAEEPVQEIHAAAEVELEIEYYQAQVEVGEEMKPPGPVPDACARETPLTPTLETDTIIRQFIRPFDLSKAPLLRLGLVSLPGGKQILMFDMHHIICDGTSVNLLINEFGIFYLRQELPLLRLQYKDFCEWQYHRLRAGKLKRQETYWLDCFSGDLPAFPMPFDYPRPALQRFSGETIHFCFPEELTRKIKTLARESKTTLYIVLLAIYNVLLNKYTLQEDIIVGSAVAFRNQAGLAPIIGLLIETIAVRNYPREDQPFDRLLAEVKANTLKAFENQDYPFGQLIKHVGNETDRSRSALFNAMLIVQNVEGMAQEREIGDIKLIPIERPSQHDVLVDLDLEAREKENRLFFKLNYCTELFKRETMERLISVFKEIAAAVVDRKEIKLKDIHVSFDLGTAESDLYRAVGSEFEF